MGLRHIAPVKPAKRVPAMYVRRVLLCVSWGVLGHCSRGREEEGRTVARYVNAAFLERLATA